MTSIKGGMPVKTRVSHCLPLFVSMATLCISAPATFGNDSNSSGVAGLTERTLSDVDSCYASHHIPLNAGVDTKEQSQLSQNVDQLLNSALSKKTAFTKSESAVRRYRAPKQKTWTKMKDASNFLVPWHGFGPSSEAGDVILDEKIKLKSLEAAEYARQKEVDDTHLAVVEKMLCLAETAGTPNIIEQQTRVNIALGALSELTSQDDAQKTLRMIKDLDTSQITELVSSSEFKPLSIIDRKRKCKELSESFISNDPVAQEVIRRLHLYNKRGTLTSVGGHVVQTTLGVATLIPNVLAPASQGCLMTYEMANGGTEESKLIKELYLEKRLQSRCQSLVEEAHLAIDAYESAMTTHNYSLAALSRAIMNDLGDANTTASVLDSATQPKLAGTLMVTP